MKICYIPDTKLLAGMTYMASVLVKLSLVAAYLLPGAIQSILKKAQAALSVT